MTDAELRNLLQDCLTLWRIEGRVAAGEAGLEVRTADGSFVVERADPDARPVRWLLQTPLRRAASRSPRAAPAIGALLHALRNALGAERGMPLRIGVGGMLP
jgi:hypothetical protein